VASSDTIEAVREVDGFADHAYVRTAQGPEREHLEVPQCYRDVHAGGRLDLVDLALPLGGDRGADVDKPTRARDRLLQVSRRSLGDTEEPHHGVAEELIEHPAVVDDTVARPGGERRQRAA